MTENRRVARARHYEPWKGDHFDDPQSGFVPKGVRLLVLGESAHGKKRHERQPDYPSNIVRWSVFKRESYAVRFFSDLTRCFAQLGHHDPRFQAIWHDVAFWEYIQEPMPRPGISPTRRQFDNAHPAFEETVAELKPTHVWAISKRLWQRMTDENSEYAGCKTPEGATVEGTSSFGCYRYKRPFGDFLAWGTYHPARPQYFKARAVRPCLKAFLSWRL